MAPGKAPGSGVTERWICVFEGRAGARAQASFGSEAQAREFAERHALTTVTAIPLKWSDNDNERVLATSFGDYRIIRTDADERHGGSIHMYPGTLSR
jgi:hypothetical protein